MDDADAPIFTAFMGDRYLTTGPGLEVALAARAAQAEDPDRFAAIFDDATGKAADFDLSGSADAVRARLAPPAKRPGRPRLGVTAREVTLLPRHWDWLATQPGGASVALRKLVEEARKSGRDARRNALDAAYRVMSALAGDRPGFEETARSLFAGDAAGFELGLEPWPADIARYLRRLASPAFGERLG